ncbi:hypothetical protein T01_1185 [Trichinella spiralis]|uniref:Uncharacterized protein n=1 Tax=Trichinella spiralis TaxID=6334 RepID=A0A0V0ZP00_TRISP|nr:hypothetical protein T01_1185 [Trichinella spiralis]
MKNSGLVRSGCRGAVYTNLEVNTVLRTAPHAVTCTADDYIFNASTSLETAGQFPTFRSMKSAMYRSRAKRFPPLPATR